MKNTAKSIMYSLPDGRTVAVHADVARYRSWVHYQLADGRIVLAVIVDQETR